jgi:hypothetical protein
MITEDYVSFETAKLLKEKGFDEATYHDYNDNGSRWFEEVLVCHNSQGGIACPTLQMAMKWLREVHKIYIEIGVSIDLLGNPHFNYSIVNKDGKYFREGYTSFEWEYEKACEAAIKYCLENLI